MSENDEHSPDDTETETKVIEDLPNDSSKASETRLMMVRTDTALLEDEEMPTFVSIPSTTRCEDDSDTAKQQENAPTEEEGSPSPYPSDDQAGSVYVVSSGEDSEHIYNEEDDEEEFDEDSDDMENLELEREMHSEWRPNNPNSMRHWMGEEDEDDDEEGEENPKRMYNDKDNDDHNDDIEDKDEYYGRASADLILNKGLEKYDKEKSSSLQDLSVYRNMYSGYNKKRYLNIAKHNYINFSQNVIFPMARKKQIVPERYQHVQSKIKHYIKDIKEQQNRRSVEKNIKYHEGAIHNKNNPDCKNNDMEEIRPTTTNRIKDYAEKTIKELEIAEARDNDRVIYSALPLMLNGQDNKNNLELIQEGNAPAQIEIQINTPFDSTQGKRDTVNSNDKMEQRQNGTIDVTLSERKTQQFRNTMQPCLIQNGHQEAPTLFNLRTLSYEEYMQCSSGSSRKIDLNQNARIIEEEHTRSETYDQVEPMDVSDIDNNATSPYSLKIENIKSIRTIADDMKDNSEQITFGKVNNEYNKTTSEHALEIIALKDQLNQKSIECDSLRDSYQKKVAENLKMKQELEELRKSLEKYKNESKPPEQKVAAMQTDFIIYSAADEDYNHTESVRAKQSNTKVSNNSVASIELSSIEHWTDNNLSISMKPPKEIKQLHSDDSEVLTDGTPRKNMYSMSRAFVTSSRILETLSKLVQGKTNKPEIPLLQNSKRRLSENAAMELQNDDSYQDLPSSSKKRKIADVFRPSSSIQSSKVSQIIAEPHSKLSEMSSAESQLKHSRDLPNEKLESQENSSNVITSQLGDTTSINNKVENTNDSEDNVKCFIYQENENCKDRSFLILADEPAKDKIINEKGHIRECGPFLLGNIEVRMSEINGTINIWGKEINDGSVIERENEMEAKVKDDKKCNCSQSISYARFNGSNMVCSSSKKSKIPAKFELSSAPSNISCPHSISLNTSKPSCSTEKIHADNTCTPSIIVSPYEDCDSLKHRKEWQRCKRIHPQEKSHSCCTHNVDILGHKWNCPLYKEAQKFEDNFNCSKERLSVKEHQQSCSRNENINPATDDEFTCRHHTACHHSLREPKENYSESHKCCNTSRTSICEQLVMNADREYSGCNYHSSNIDDEDPLIKQSSETPETRRRRLTGKRVRGILKDFLRGCGDCYNPNAPNSSKNYSYKKESSCPASPQIKISPCASPETSFSNPGQSGGRCCHAYAQRIESQLEEFRVEMEKVRSRSDTILNMLNMLRSVDAN